MRTILLALFMTLATQSHSAELQLTGEWFCDGENRAQISIVNDTLILSHKGKAPIIAELVYQNRTNDNDERPIHDFLFKRIGANSYFFVNQMNTSLTAQGILGSFATVSRKFSCKPNHMEFKTR